MVEVFAEAIKLYDVKLFFAEVDLAYQRLQLDTAAWEEYQAENRLWDRALGVGLDAEDAWETTASNG